MAMSTQILTEASKLLSHNVLNDNIGIYTAGDPVTTGIYVSKSLTEVDTNVAALVQTITLENAVESRTANTYSIKVAQGVELVAGMVIEVEACHQDSSLVGKKLIIDKVTQNGLAMIHKAVASDWSIVNQEGKEDL